LVTAIYLAHLNPVTNAHVEIINDLKNQASTIKVMPVIFLKDEKELNTRSFPFSYEIRKKMVESVFGDSIQVSKNYTFQAPFSKYFPPIVSRLSWVLRKQILNGVEDDYFTYTGDKAEGIMLKMYRLNPKIGKRKQVSASSVKNKLYDAALGNESKWKDDVPSQVAKIIEENWNIVEKFAKIEDDTTRVAGMKFPKDGWSK
jgi:nicotinamide mononucleotide adenylyltransferase